MNRTQGPSFMSRVLRLVIVVAVIFGAYQYVESNGGIEKTMDSATGVIFGGVEKVGDSLADSMTPGAPGDRPYKDTNKESLKILANNIGDVSDTRGYERSAFGSGWNRVSNFGSVGWEDFPNTSCSVRQATLIEQGENVTYSDDCTINGGQWTGVYGSRDDSGQVTHLQSDDSSDFDIDHVVALSLAWRSGADKLDDSVKNEIANDRANLLVSSASVNRSKGDQDIVDWTPPVDSPSYCDYTDRYSHIKASYSLKVTQAEYDKIEEIIESCNA